MKWRRVLILAVICLLCGILITSHVLAHILGNIAQQHEQQVHDTADSADRSITSLFRIYRDILADLTLTENCAAAEAHWLQTQDATLLQACLQQDVLLRNASLSSLLAIQEDRILCSTDLSRQYQIPKVQGDIFLCQDDDGNIYIAIRHQSQNLSYAAVIKPEVLCKYILQHSQLGEDDEFLLVDRNAEFVIQYCDGITQFFPLAEANDDQNPLLANIQDGLNQNVLQTNMRPSGSGIRRSIVGYGLLGNAGSNNQFFTISIGLTFDAFFGSLYLESAMLTVSFAVIIMGMILLMLNTVVLSHKNKTTTLELQRLKKRERALEKINQQTQQLAHHQRLETIGTLTSSISHEFNNLLTPIMSYSLLTLERLPAEEEELYDNILEIYNASQKAKVIISRLSDLSRKNSPNTFREASMDALVQKALDIAMPAKPQDVEVKLDLNCRDLRIRANEIQICQMLLNMILNAFQAMPEQGLLQIQTSFDHDQVHLHITDNGCGIPPEAQARIFEPFYTTKDPGKGTGLGLAIVAQVLQDHNGSIEVFSEVGEGTRFHIRLPRPAEPAENELS